MAKKTAYYGMLLALAMIFSYVEGLLPLPIPLPGVKLGLANLVALLLLCTSGFAPAAGVNLARIVLSGLLFGNAQGMLIGLGGGVCSLAAMGLLRRCGRFSVYGISMGGGAAHGVGQLVSACVLLRSMSPVYYLPVLMLSGALTGWLIAFAAAQILPRMPHGFANGAERIKKFRK